MKLDCYVVEDLLPLYLDEVCSEQTKALVAEHIENCETCKKLMEEGQTVQIPHIELQKPEVDNAVRKGFKKIRIRWMASVIAVFLLIPLIGLGFLGYHEKRNEGIAFSNLDDVYRCFRYLHCIKDNEFEKASEMVDFPRILYDQVENVADMSPEEFERYMKDRLVKKLKEYDALGISIDNIRYDSAYKVKETGVWCICISFDEIYPDGSKQKIVAHLNGESLYAGAYSYPEEGKIKRDDYIDEILYLYSEDDPLGYLEFEVTFELKEGERAVIRKKGNSDIGIDGVFNMTFGTGTDLFKEVYHQDTFETAVPGMYSVIGYTKDGQRVFLSTDDLNIEIVSYKEE